MRALQRTLRAAAARVFAEVVAFVCSLHAVAADVRRNRAIVEKEIYRGKYKHASKNDDDLPAFE